MHYFLFLTLLFMTQLVCGLLFYFRLIPLRVTKQLFSVS